MISLFIALDKDLGEKIPFGKKRVGEINDFAMLCLRCQKNKCGIKTRKLEMVVEFKYAFWINRKYKLELDQSKCKVIGTISSGREL